MINRNSLRTGKGDTPTLVMIKVACSILKKQTLFAVAAGAGEGAFGVPSGPLIDTHGSSTFAGVPAELEPSVVEDCAG